MVYVLMIVLIMKAYMIEWLKPFKMYNHTGTTLKAPGPFFFPKQHQVEPRGFDFRTTRRFKGETSTDSS